MSRRMFWIGYGLAATLGGIIGAWLGPVGALVGAGGGAFGWTFAAIWVERRGR